MILLKSKSNLEMYRVALLEILHKQSKLKKGKSYPVGTIREWKGKKFKKLPNGKWMRYYQETKGRGVDQALRNTIKKIKNATSIQELADIVRNNKERFQDADGKMSDIVQRLLKEARGTAVGTKKQQAIADLPTAKRETVTSPEFLNWFGDWIHIPETASKVTDKYDIPVSTSSTEPVRVYHGTSKGGFTAFRKDKLQGGIYGTGLYFTEDKSIAEEYTKKDTDKPELLVRTFKDKAGNESIISKDLLTSIIKKGTEDNARNNANHDYGTRTPYTQLADNPNLDKYINKFIEEMGDKTYTLDDFRDAISKTEVPGFGGQDVPLHSFDFMMESVIGAIRAEVKAKRLDLTELEYQSQVYEVYMNIRNPMDMNAPISTAQYKEFMGGMNDLYMDDVLTYDQWHKQIGMDYATDAKSFTYDKAVLVRNVMRKMKHEKDYTSWNGHEHKAGDPVFPVMHLNKTDKLTWGELQYIITNTQSMHYTDQFTDRVKALGYDGIKHTGGWNIGTKTHEVWIAFEPNQVKSVENSGTFDPSSDDLYKGLTMKLFIKARPYPDGTVRSWSGKKYVKKAGHWEPVGADTSRKNTSDSGKDKKPQRRSTDKGKKEVRSIKGSKEMLTELKKVEKGTRIFLDDLDGDKKKLFNVLTKEGLITWKDAGNSEYKAVLTPAGERALDGADGFKAKSKRKSKGKK